MTENISLCLKTTQISTATTFANYLIQQYQHQQVKYLITEQHIHGIMLILRNLLGPIYDKYNNFNISLNSVITSTHGISDLLTAASTNDRLLQLKMSGLQWLNFL